MTNIIKNTSKIEMDYNLNVKIGLELTSYNKYCEIYTYKFLKKQNRNGVITLIILNTQHVNRINIAERFFFLPNTIQLLSGIPWVQTPAHIYHSFDQWIE